MSRRSLPPRAPSTRPATLAHDVDVLVVGAGIVGLAHAVEASARGASVVVVERDDRALGASVRSLGHVAVTAQDGPALACALVTRDKWIALGRQAGFDVSEAGSVVVARAEDELAVLEDFVCARDGAAHLLDRAGVARHLRSVDDDVVGGALLATDLRVDPRVAVPEIARWLSAQPRAAVVTGTSVLGVEPGSGRSLVRTSRGDVIARTVVLAVGADVDRLLPAVAEAHGLTRRTRQALRVTGPTAPGERGAGGGTVLLGGTAVLHHAGLTRSPQHKEVRERLEREQPEVVAAEVNLRATPLADGSLLLGDAGAQGGALPFRAEALDELLLREGERLVGGPLRVVERWAAVEATAPEPFVVARPQRGLLVVTVGAPIGLSTAFGLAPRTLDGLL
ncbi:FAD-dependent oxidoreductase [Xylanimonas ulmi]|uniref:FAD dependent oxidoreductase TIGR03364 n=1 Tax=Xylanimonas ulmi TaxID=228973 RepID=A0A4Q7M0H1_9MICO|nr:FAD-dependent oxidoreductase [Xylanibacterium ulmi]RZS60844.1 FAD dependent oxidoreductase TIGR03364 [Xylanibacterium ulmi]